MNTDDRPAPRPSRPRGLPRPVRLDPDGCPVDAKDWTVEDWRDLYHGIAAIKARIAARHRANTEEV